MEDFLQAERAEAEAARNKTRRKKKRVISPALLLFRATYEKVNKGGPEDRVAAQKKKGKLTAMERIHYLLDENSFYPVGSLVETTCVDFGMAENKIPGDGVITGFGKINGRDVAVYAQDFTQLGGSLGAAHAKKIARLTVMAAKSRFPVIGLLDSGGARIQEGVSSLDGFGEIFYQNVQASGIVPQISVVLGPCAGGAVYSPALTDFVFMVEGISHMFVTGPNVIKSATGEEVDFDTLGGSMPHSEKSGVCHFVAKSEQDCFRQVRELLGFIPQSRYDRPPTEHNEDPIDRKITLLEKISELHPRKPYRVQHIIWWLADQHEFFEIHQNFAKNIVVGFIRLGGDTVGVVANNPAHLGGALDIAASVKAARFIRFCNNFNIPVLSLIDIGGYYPGLEQEHGGIIRNGAKLLFAYAEATVPKISLILRKAYGGAYIAMNSKCMGSDFNYALPNAEIAVMGPQGAIEILNARKFKTMPPEEQLKEKERMTTEYAAKFATPYHSAAAGALDEVLEPADVRFRLIQSFRLLKKKRTPGEVSLKGNMPT
ncbi:MAG: acyl-CoA carboxylase subunit beta [Elusimicrobiaceae bacterium]|nr:acyl-CoA carboxylase subunit beta [Elusimicrobiaceae bacterium]